MFQAGKILRLLPPLTIALMIGPVFAGLIGTLLPAFGYYPAAGFYEVSLQVFDALWAWPGLNDALRLSFTTGLTATSLSLLTVLIMLASLSHTRFFRAFERLLSPLLSVPHAAVAFGLAFLISPSGWIARLFSPWATGWERPLDLLIVHDPWGIAMTLGLMSKEIPFLLFMAIAALAQTPAKQARLTAQALGYTPFTGWFKTTLPALYPQIKLPIYVVLAYAMTVVDIAVILGPNTPPPLSVQIVKWMSSPDLALRLQAAAGALTQTALVIIALLLWRGFERGVITLGRKSIAQGQRSILGLNILDRALSVVAAGISTSLALGLILGLITLALWSFAGFWSFPNALPDSFTLKTWLRHTGPLFAAVQETTLIAATATLIALLLTLGCLEYEYRAQKPITPSQALILYTPLLVPQISFLPGLQTLLLHIGSDTGRTPVIFAHLIFVLPYVYLSLAAPFRAWDTRYAITAQAMGHSPNTVFWRIRMPMLLRPLLTAIAVGLSVSIGQYLATLLIGGGRVSTLTTEAVALSSGGDRRAIGLYALLQTMAALIPFSLALLLPTLAWRNRKGLSHD